MTTAEALVVVIVFVVVYALLGGCAKEPEQKPIVVPLAPAGAQAAAGEAPAPQPEGETKAESPADVKRNDDFGTVKVGISVGSGTVGPGISLGGNLAVSATDGSIMITP